MLLMGGVWKPTFHKLRNILTPASIKCIVFCLHGIQRCHLGILHAPWIFKGAIFTHLILTNFPSKYFSRIYKAKMFKPSDSFLNFVSASGSLHLSGWYLNANLRNARLISSCEAFLSTPSLL